jgi:large conductance mechanosensitive channel protein
VPLNRQSFDRHSSQVLARHSYGASSTSFVPRVSLGLPLVWYWVVSVLVKSLIDNVIMPPIGLLLGSAEGIKGLSWTVGRTADGKDAILHYGIFLNDTINFIVIALVIYLVIHLLKFDKLDKSKE